MTKRKTPLREYEKIKREHLLHLLQQAIDAVKKKIEEEQSSDGPEEALQELKDTLQKLSGTKLAFNKDELKSMIYMKDLNLHDGARSVLSHYSITTLPNLFDYPLKEIYGYFKNSGAELPYILELLHSLNSSARLVHVKQTWFSPMLGATLSTK